MKSQNKRRSIIPVCTIVVALILMIVGIIFYTNMDHVAVPFCDENKSLFESYEECESLDMESKINIVCTEKNYYSYLFRDDEGNEKRMGCKDIKSDISRYGDYVVNAHKYRFRIINDDVYIVGSDDEIIAGASTGMYCVYGKKLAKFAQKNACADLPEITEYLCTPDYCAMIYRPDGDMTTYIIFESYNEKTEKIFKSKYTKPMTVYGWVTPFKKGVTVRAYDNNQIQMRVERDGVSIRCSEYTKGNAMFDCSY